ncbi:recombinase RecT, partial [Erwinia amylovora]|uniref:recombinase RecT n=1 Tax=Erwinia amylovora TaxID=552 RepID=UPI00200B4F05
VFKGASNEHLAALVVVANEHRLNPFTREIYAFPDKSGGIQAVVGVDGWIRIVTQNESFDGVEFSYTGEKDDLACTCTMHVKGRSHAV